MPRFTAFAAIAIAITSVVVVSCRPRWYPAPASVISTAGDPTRLIRR